MPTDPTQPKPHEHFLHVVLPHPDKPLILMLPEGETWTLPKIEPKEFPPWPYGIFELGMKTQFFLGREVIPLRSAYFERENDDHGYRFVFAMENPLEQIPEGGCWISEDELKNLPLTHEHLRPVLETYFREQATGRFPPQRPPWAFPGWQGRAKAWIREQIAAQGWHLTGVVELRRKWCITCVMRVPTNIGDLYFKAVPPTFAREVAVTRYLEEQYPDNTPSIVAFHEAERWILMRDFGQRILGDSKEIDDWERAARDFAALQIGMMTHIDALLERGALDYRLESLPGKLDALLADEAAMRSDYQIPDADIECLRQAAPRLKEMIQELGDCHIPSTISHTDFHPWNSAVQDKHIIFFDWTDASVGHPFFDVALYFDTVSRRVFAEAPEVVAYLKTVYLQAFKNFAPLETLQRALSLGATLGLLLQTLNYHHLLQDVEPAERWSINFMAVLFKEVVDSIDEAKD